MKSSSSRISTLFLLCVLVVATSAADFPDEPQERRRPGQSHRRLRPLNKSHQSRRLLRGTTDEKKTAEEEEHDAKLKVAEEACAGIQSANKHEACIMDVYATGNPGMANMFKQ